MAPMARRSSYSPTKAIFNWAHAEERRL